MEIHIEYPGIKVKEEQLEEMEAILNKKYAMYDFVKRVEVKVINEVPNQLELTLKASLEKSEPQFVSFANANMITALNGAIKKMNGLIEKYKSKHYHNIHKYHRANKSIK